MLKNRFGDPHGERVSFVLLVMKERGRVREGGGNKMA